jgi:hypothetical protein
MDQAEKGRIAYALLIHRIRTEGGTVNEAFWDRVKYIANEIGLSLDEIKAFMAQTITDVLAEQYQEGSPNQISFQPAEGRDTPT